MPLREPIGIHSTQSSSRFPAKLLETLGADRVITLDEIDRFQFFSFDPGGAARNVDLPPVGEAIGTEIRISNEADAAEVLTIRLAGAGATIVTPTQDEACILWCDGVSWFGLVGATA